MQINKEVGGQVPRLLSFSFFKWHILTINCWNMRSDDECLVKMVFLGAPSAGKTCLLGRYINGKFQEGQRAVSRVKLERRLFIKIESRKNRKCLYQA